MTIREIARLGLFMSLFILLLVLVSPVNSQQATPAGYVYKPLRPTGWHPPMKPFVRFADVKAQHRGEKEWSEWVVKDEHLWSQYIQSAPGSKVSPRFHPDTREWWVIVEGQIRFNIEGQEPFVARRRSMVQVPPQTIYSMETIGDVPAIRFETNIQHALTIYVEPPGLNLPGFEIVPVTTARKPFPYDKINKPHINLDDLITDPNYTGSRFVDDARAVSNIIFTRDPSSLPPVMEHDTSHWHAGGGEYWIVLMGQIRFPSKDRKSSSWTKATWHTRQRSRGTSRADGAVARPAAWQWMA